MRESSWDECIEFNSSVSISKDFPKAKSLLETSQARIKFLEGNKADQENSNFIFEGYYSSALEMLHALLFAQGYKVINHICLGYYLKEVIKNEPLYRIFDDCRIKRNNLVYYGKKLDFESAQASINKLKSLMKEIKLLLSKELGK